MKRKIAILLRVYDRIEDLKYNLQIIKDTWNIFDYYIVVVTNGYSDGYTIKDDIASQIDDLVILNSNSGHRRGSSQLLQEGRLHIPMDCEYTIILEADTWVYSDRTIAKYIAVMDGNTNVVWASADWYDKDYSLAVDIAIIRSKYIQDHEGLFDIDLYPECYIANYLKENGGNFILIKENMPVHIPSYMSKYPYINDHKNKRFYIFPQSKMVTHHIEFLKNGMSQKKLYFNIVSGRDYFPDEKPKNRKWQVFKIRFWISFSSLLPKKSWFKGKKYRVLNREL
ncbi:hypothetical protein [Dysgonomonas capnocytophagoides]|uniref:hypothetical protein n=1 Tax=Dysgonomonas capnocytophagoides TaxID=45254 RepID=UPI003342B57E